MDDRKRMRCMEVWGGNRAVNSAVATTGLDLWVYSRPCGASVEGGDVYYLSSCASGRITRFLLADVSGHGAGAAEAGDALRALMRRNINFVNQNRFVRQMNGEFVEAMADRGIFATALVSTFFCPTRSLSICNAGHPHPLLYRRRLGEWRIVQRDLDPAAPTNVPLGIVDESSYDDFRVKLGVGDMLLCYTDSLIEAMDERGAMLGSEGLLEIASTIPVTEPGEYIPRLLGAIGAQNKENLSLDDVSVLLLRANGGGAPLRDTLLAPLRLLRGLGGRQ